MSKIGIFTAGYRWSGSGAVSDWLGGHPDLCRVEGSEAAFGEIRAINYGIRHLVQTAAGRVFYGERFGRWALCPNPQMWKDVLGRSMTRERGRFSGIYELADLLFFTAAQFYTIPHVTKYKEMLNAQLGENFAEDEEYLELVSGLTKSLRNYMRGKKPVNSFLGPEHDESVKLAASGLLSLFYERLGRDKRFLIFDNAVSGLTPELFHLLHPFYFSGQIIIFVRRDPRDQFAELVKYSGSTFSWSVGKFIRQYKHTQENTKSFLEALSRKEKSEAVQVPQRFIRQITFESFVLNKNDLRNNLKNDLQEFWVPFGISRQDVWKEGSTDSEVIDGGNGFFNAEQSKTNIGIWRNSGLSRQMAKISEELADYIEDF